MTDRFLAALEDVCDAVSAGESIEQAVTDAAAEHELVESALMNRAKREVGDVERYREGRAKVATHERVRAIQARLKADKPITKEELDLVFNYMNEVSW